MELKYHLAKDTIHKDDIDALIEWLKSYPRLTQGALVREFEKVWRTWLGAKHAVMVNSGSSANLLMHHALLYSGRRKNKKIIVPSCGWATTIAPALQLGFEPIMCEADPDTWGLDLACLKTLLEEHGPGAVMLVHVLGVPHTMDEVMALKEQYGFTLLEDTCAAIGASYKGKHVGTFGEMASISLYFGHQISTIEGGIVTTDDDELYEHLLMGRSHGWGKELPKDVRAARQKKYNVDPAHNPFVFYEPGYNLRATDLQAFLGIRQVDRMDEIIKKRSVNHAHYKKLLEGHIGMQTYSSDDTVCSIHFCGLAKNGAEREIIVRALEEAGIETRLFTAGNLGRHPFWADIQGEARFKTADKLYDTGFFLPNHPLLTEEDVAYIARVVVQSIT